MTVTTTRDLVDVLTPNLGELMGCVAAVTGEDPARSDPPDLVAVEALARRLIRDGGIGRAVVVKLGPDGALLVPVAGPAVHVAGHRVRSVDATGAGDSFSGALARVSGETVAGSPYAIQQGTLALSSNYALTFVGPDEIVQLREIEYMLGRLLPMEDLEGLAADKIEAIQRIIAASRE